MFHEMDSIKYWSASDASKMQRFQIIEAWQAGTPKVLNNERQIPYFNLREPCQFIQVHENLTVRNRYCAHYITAYGMKIAASNNQRSSFFKDYYTCMFSDNFYNNATHFYKEVFHETHDYGSAGFKHYKHELLNIPVRIRKSFKENNPGIFPSREEIKKVRDFVRAQEIANQLEKL